MNCTMKTDLSSANVPFCTGVAHQKYLGAEKGIRDAFESGCTHWYVDGSLHGEMVDDWDDQRIDSLNRQIQETGVKPIFHGNFKAPLGSDVEAFRAAAVEYVKKEIDIASRLGAPLIIHGGCVVEPKMIVQAKKIALDNYLKSIVELSQYASEKGLTDIYLENLSNYVNYRPFHYIFTHDAEYTYVIERLLGHKNVFLFLDAGHANIEGGRPAEVIRKYHRLIRGISFSNNNGIQDQHFGIHDGTCDYRDVVNAIIETSWRGLVAFETRNQSAQAALRDLCGLYQENLGYQSSNA